MERALQNLVFPPFSFSSQNRKFYKYDYSYDSQNKMFEEKLEQFIENLKEKFQGYFIGLGAKARGNKYIVNVIIDDRDVKTMNKKSLYSLLQKHIDMINNTPDRIQSRTTELR